MRRRQLFGYGGGALAAVAGLSSCGKPPSAQDFGPPAATPDFRQISGLGRPDIAGTSDGTIPPSYFSYPSSPMRTVQGTPGDGRPISMLTETFSAIPPAVNNNTYWSGLNTALGSELKIQIVTSTDFPVKFATVVAGNALPDMFFVDPDFPRTPELMAARAVDLSDHLSGSKILDYPNLANLPTDCWDVGRFNGRLYGLPSPRGALQSGILYRRDDLLAKKGISGDVGSFAEFADLCGELTDARGGVWALTTVPMQFIRNMLNIPNFWRFDGNTMQSWWTAPEQEQALEAGRKIVAGGLINPDAFSSPQTKTWFGSGKAYFNSDAVAAWPQYYSSHKPGDGFDIGGCAIPAFDGGGQGKLWLSFPSYGMSAISLASADRVDTLLKVADYLAAPFGSVEYLKVKYGAEGPDYTMKDGNPSATSAGSAGSQLGVKYIVDSPQVNYIPGQAAAGRKVDKLLRQLVPEALTNDAVYLYSPTAAERFSRSQTRFQNLEDDILQGRRAVSEWRTEANSWWSRYGQQMSTELTEAYHAAGRG